MFKSNKINELERRINELEYKNKQLEKLNLIKERFLFNLGDYLHNFGTNDFYWAKEKKVISGYGKEILQDEALYIGYLFLGVRHLLSSSNTFRSTEFFVFDEDSIWKMRMITKEAYDNAVRKIQDNNIEQQLNIDIELYELHCRVLINEFACARSILYGQELYEQEILVTDIKQLDGRRYMMEKTT